MVKFTATKRQVQTIGKISERARETILRSGSEAPIKWELMMDIEAVHCNGNPLRLDALLSADEFNFSHDIVGIRNNLNRETGKLENCFVPRYSV